MELAKPNALVKTWRGIGAKKHCLEKQFVKQLETPTLGRRR